MNPAARSLLLRLDVLLLFLSVSLRIQLEVKSSPSLKVPAFVTKEESIRPLSLGLLPQPLLNRQELCTVCLDHLIALPRRSEKLPD